MYCKNHQKLAKAATRKAAQQVSFACPRCRYEANSSASRVASLEDRLDALTTAIEAQNSLPSRSLAMSGSSSPAQTPRSHALIQSPVIPSIASPASSTTTSKASPAPPRQSSTSWPSTRPPPPLGLTWPQAERILAIYRDICLYNFPFVWIPGHMTAQELCESKPCLFRAVMLSSAPLPVARLKKMKRNVIAYISQHMLVEEERSLDVLQGLLIVIAWYARPFE